MPRPCKQRKICGVPNSCYFKPQGIPLAELKRYDLSYDLWEALRLVDAEQKEHEEASSIMNVSRPTLSRMIKKARNIVAKALCEGAAIKIDIQKNDDK